MRLGLNSGLVIVGSIGDDLKMDYTAFGDTTNLASRMESMAMPGNILVASETFQLVRDFFEFESLGKVDLKGKEKPLEAYKLCKAGEVETRIEASVAKGLTRFVGRKNSMAALREALAEAKAGSGQVVGIVGDAGVGKSRILLEFKNPLPQNEYALPPLMELLSLKIEDEDFSKLEPQQKRERTFETIRNLLIRVSQECPLVLAVEDLHGIDKTSEEFLNYLIDFLISVEGFWAFIKIIKKIWLKGSGVEPRISVHCTFLFDNLINFPYSQ
jgi:hypothetical protein